MRSDLSLRRLSGIICTKIFNDWTGTEFDAILKSVKRRLRPSTGSAASKPSSSVASDASINKPVTQKWKETEATEVDRSPQRPGSQLHERTDLTQKEIKCEKYSTPKNISDTLKNTLAGHGGRVYSVSFNQEGLLASGSYDKTIKLWNFDAGECIRTFNGHKSFVLCVNFDRKGLLASGSEDKTIKLWNATTGECIRTLTGHDGVVFSVSFDQEGTLASGSSGTDIEFFFLTFHSLSSR